MDEEVAKIKLHRNSLISYIYRLTGSIEDAQDIVQETMLKYINTKTQKIQNPKAWMFKVATNLSWDFLKSSKNKRELYKGPWLPDPYTQDEYSMENEIELDESLSMALLVLMETLSIKERIVYILNDIFDFSHDETADILNTTTQNSRQLSSRANKKLKVSKKKFTPTTKEHEKLTTSFLIATKKGDFNHLQQIFSDELILLSDGGGKAKAAQKIVRGSRAVSLFIIKIISKNLLKNGKDIIIKRVWFNGSFGFVILHKQKIVSSFNFEIYRGKISAIFVLRNPDKLKFLTKSC